MCFIVLEAEPFKCDVTVCFVVNSIRVPSFLVVKWLSNGWLYESFTLVAKTEHHRYA